MNILSRLSNSRPIAPKVYERAKKDEKIVKKIEDLKKNKGGKL